MFISKKLFSPISVIPGLMTILRTPRSFNIYRSSSVSVRVSVPSMVRVLLPSRVQFAPHSNLPALLPWQVMAAPISRRSQFLSSFTRLAIGPFHNDPLLRPVVPAAVTGGAVELFTQQRVALPQQLLQVAFRAGVVYVRQLTAC